MHYKSSFHTRRWSACPRRSKLSGSTRSGQGPVRKGGEAGRGAGDGRGWEGEQEEEQEEEQQEEQQESDCCEGHQGSSD